MEQVGSQNQTFLNCYNNMIVNKIIMDSELRHNKTGSILSSIDSNPAEMKLEEYQKNMKIFIQSVQKQMASMIDKYQNKIKQLKQEISRLKAQLQKKGSISMGFGNGLQSHMTECFSPIKSKGGSIAGMQTARSHFFQELPLKNFLSSEHNFFQPETKSSNFDYKFELVKTPQTLNKSRFEMESKKQKQRQQDLLHFLEMGKSNLELNTGKMFDLVGRSKKQQQNKDQQNEEANNNQSPAKKRKGSDAHNTSLNSICDSLNNSFHGKKAQQKSLKKRNEMQQKQKEEARKEHERQKFKKQQGIKNLLTTMRKNISSSLDRPVQVIKGSKLLSTGEKGKSVQPTKAKVMINPVPVDLQQINKQKHHNSVTTSPSKHVQSILKNSSTNFLTKSIENISAISFYSSGQE